MKPKKKDEHCSCCGRYLINAKVSTLKEQFCHKCGIVHLANVMSNEPNERIEEGIQAERKRVCEIIEKGCDKYLFKELKAELEKP